MTQILANLHQLLISSYSTTVWTHTHMDTLDRIKNNTLLHRSAGTQGNNDPILNNNKILN